MTLFDRDRDFEAFLKVMRETVERVPEVDLLSFCVMPNHWHLAVRPRVDGRLSEFMRLLTVTHTQRWHAHRRSAGTGPVYQGRYKSFVVQGDEHFLTLARYIEQNPLRAGLVERAEDWRWSSLAVRREGPAEWRGMLRGWPTPGSGAMGVPRGWLRTVNAIQGEAELAGVRRSVKRGRPLGDERWTDRTAAKLGLGATLRPPGRPRKNGT